MIVVLVTGMSGTGKSAALAELERRGHRVVDNDSGGWTEGEPGSERFDAVVLLSAPAEVILERITKRESNEFGKTAAERDLILNDLATVEPLLRAGATAEIDTRAPLGESVEELERIGGI